MPAISDVAVLSINKFVLVSFSYFYFIFYINLKDKTERG
jgi:hypothetical protein